MKTRFLLSAAIFLAIEASSLAQSIVYWSGGGDGVSWADPSNWIGQQIPAPNNSVVVSNGFATNIVISNSVTIESIQCAPALTITAGSLGVTAGASVLQGSLTMTGGSTLSASGTNTTFVCTGPTVADQSVFYVIGGATLSLPGLQSYSTACGAPTWTITDPGSVLSLPGMTNIDVLYCGNGMRIEVEAGGQLQATNLSTMTAGWYLQVQADGSNSLANLSGLQSVSGNVAITFESSAGGTNWIPEFVGGPNAYVTLNPDATLPVAQIQQLGGITANGVIAAFPELTEFDGGNISLNSGANVTLPALQSYGTGCVAASWIATGPGTLLDLPALTNIAAPYCGDGMRIEAESGAQVVATNLATFNADWYVQVDADGADSMIDFSGLMTVSGSFPVTFEASTGGTNWIPQFLGGPNAYLTLNADATIPVVQLRQLGGITASGVTVTLPFLTNFDGGNVNLSSGTTITFPALQNYSTVCTGPLWSVTGPDAVLSFPALTNISAPYCGDGLRIEAESGGEVLATNLANIVAGWYVNVQADGADSIVNLSGLRSVPGGYPITFEASAGGTDWIPQFLGGPNADVILNPDSTIPLTQVRQLGGITANGVSVTLPSITNFDGGSVNLSGGSSITFPTVQSYSTLCGSPSWIVNGSGAVLAFPELTNITTLYCGGGMTIEAEAGGQVLATNLLGIDAGWTTTIQSDGSNSLASFPALIQVSGSYAANFEASAGGSNWMPQFTGSPNANVTVNPGGILSVAQLLQLGNITANGVTVSFPALTNVAGILAEAAADLSLPSIGSISLQNAGPSWEVTGTGSILDLSGLTNLVGSFCCQFNIAALAGGQLLLNNLATIQNGTVSFLADGAGSAINLTGLSGFTCPVGQGSITAQNDGAILFNNQAFILDNVSINIPAGNPVLPPVFIAPKNLTLYGTAWNSYRVYERNTLIPGSPWQLLALVPLTNSFQAFAGAPPANTAYQVTEFVANPPILQLSSAPVHQVQLVLYGLTNATYQIQTNGSLLTPGAWVAAGTVSMTNSFRILPPATPTTNMLFYRAKQQ